MLYKNIMNINSNRIKLNVIYLIINYVQFNPDIIL